MKEDNITYRSRRFWFLTMDLGKQCFELLFKSLVFRALKEFADEGSTWFEGLVCKIKSCLAKFLSNCQPCQIGKMVNIYHAADVISKIDAARVHHPAIRVT